MALAEPRRRQKWSMNPRGNLWANDQEKVGLKLMQKMGYESGKGLGVKEDGIIAPITARAKLNSKGIGFDGPDDTWLAHQDDFQAVLASLNVEHGSTEAQEAGKKSLEKLSKKSKKRVHYQKFTRGKDLANYSIDDLGCILGTKSEKLKTMQKEKKEKEEKKLIDEAAEQEPEKKHGVVTLQGGNYHEYFQKKMAQLKAKGLPTFGDDQIKQENCDILIKVDANGDVKIKVEAEDVKIKVETEEDVKIKVEANEDVKIKVEADESADNSTPTTDLNKDEEPTPKKKKKSKKEKKDKESSEEPIVKTDKENVDDSSEGIEKSSKKSKKSKKVELENTEVIVEEKTEKKKKKRDKCREVEEIVVEEEISKKKKNKKLEKDQAEDELAGKKRSHEEFEQDQEESSKKRKKNSKKEKKSLNETDKS